MKARPSPSSSASRQAAPMTRSRVFMRAICPGSFPANPPSSCRTCPARPRWWRPCPSPIRRRGMALCWALSAVVRRLSLCWAIRKRASTHVNSDGLAASPAIISCARFQVAFPSTRLRMQKSVRSSWAPPARARAPCPFPWRLMSWRGRSSKWSPAIPAAMKSRWLWRRARSKAIAAGPSPPFVSAAPTGSSRARSGF